MTAFLWAFYLSATLAGSGGEWRIPEAEQTAAPRATSACIREFAEMCDTGPSGNQNAGRQRSRHILTEEESEEEDGDAAIVWLPSDTLTHSGRSLSSDIGAECIAFDVFGLLVGSTHARC